jgi:hypothetical protein
MVTVPGETVNIEVSLLASVTITPPGGAAAGSVTCMAVDWPSPTVTPEGSERLPGELTVTVAVALVTLGVAALAVIVVVPSAAPVTEMFAVVAPAAIVEEPAIVTTPAGLSASVTFSPPPGAGADKVRVSVLVSVPEMLRVCGEKLNEPATVTGWLEEVYPGADAVIEAVPKLTPVTCG